MSHYQIIKPSCLLENYSIFAVQMIKMIKKHLNIIILGISIILTAFVLANAYSNRNKNTNRIFVTGLGSTDFKSDLIVWNGTFIQRNKDLKKAYEGLNRDKELIKQYLISKGIKESQIIFSAVDIDQDIESYYDNGKYKSVNKGFKLSQGLQIESKEVEKIENISREVTEIIQSGIEFYSRSPEYYYTKLAELKLNLIGEATKDAYNRAKLIADNSGSKVGSLKNATQGVFQIIAQNSSEDFSWGGSFNTDAKNKTATITIKLEYEVD